MSDITKKLLIIGKQYTKSDPSRVGGVIVLFELLKFELNSMDIEYDVLDLNWRNYRSKLSAYLYICWKLMASGFRYSHVSFHGTANEFFYLSPIVVLSGRFLNKRCVSLRKFAGNFDSLLNNANWAARKLSAFSLKNANQCFFETRALVKNFEKFNDHTYWFPNVRRRSPGQADAVFRKRFVFIGHVSPVKGVDLLLGVFEELAPDHRIEFYGPNSGNYAPGSFAKENISYGGVLDPADVYDVLENYDVLVVPTKHESEGYPGVIIEAYAVGLPVIATKIGGIQEIVDDTTGILVDPGDPEQLREAVLSITPQNYPDFQVGAKRRFAQFDSSEVTREYLRKIEYIA